MTSQEKNVSALMRMADDIQFRAQASREELAIWANSIRSLAAAISNDSPTPPAGDAGAVAWQYRYVLKDVGYFTGWAHASSEGELANTVNHYTENGYTIEYRPLYTHPPSTPPYPPSTRETAMTDKTITKDGVRVAVGQIWRDGDKRMRGRTVTITRVCAMNGLAYYEKPVKNRISIKNMHGAKWELVAPDMLDQHQGDK